MNHVIESSFDEKFNPIALHMMAEVIRHMDCSYDSYEVKLPDFGSVKNPMLMERKDNDNLRNQYKYLKPRIKPIPEIKPLPGLYFKPKY